MRTLSSRTIILYFIFNIITLLAFNYAVIVELFHEWYNPGPYNHGFLGLALVLYIFWTKKDFFISLRPSLFGVALLLAVNIIFLIANLANIGQLQILSLFLIITSLLISVYGFSVIKIFSKPWMMLILTLPIWNLIQLPLQSISTWVSFYVVQMFGFDIIREGHDLITSGGVFIVEPACSGLGFFLTSALYAIFVSEVNNLSKKSSCIYFLLAISFSIVANWLRIIIIVMVGAKTHMQHYIVQDHLTFGWFVFMACFIPIIIIGHRYFNEREAPAKVSFPSNKKINIWLPILSFLIILSFAISTLIISFSFDKKYQFILPEIPSYTHINTNSTTNYSWFPTSHGVTSEEFSYFSQNKNLFQIYLANYVKQSQGSEMIFIGNRLFDKSRWYNTNEQKIPFEHTPLFKTLNILTLEKNNHRSRLIAYWYLIDSQYVSDKKIAKLLEVKAALKGRPGATLIAVALDFKNENKHQAIIELSKFVDDFIQQPINIQKTL